MVTKKRALVLIVGILLIFAMACVSDSDSKPATVTGDDGVAAAYEARSFDEVKPQNGNAEDGHSFCIAGNSRHNDSH